MVHLSRVPWRELGMSSECKGKHPLCKVKQSSSQSQKIQRDRVLGLYHRPIKQVLDYSLGVVR